MDIDQYLLKKNSEFTRIAAIISDFIDKNKGELYDRTATIENQFPIFTSIFCNVNSGIKNVKKCMQKN